MRGNTLRKTLGHVTCGLVLMAAPTLAVDSKLAPSSPGVLADASELGGTGDNWIDHFDTYTSGSQIHGQGGWQGWDNDPAASALVSSTQAHTGTNSVDISGGTDLVYRFSGHTGTWVLSARQYIPSSFSGTSYFIMLNTYNDGGPYNWSVQVPFDSSSGTVANDGASGGVLPIIFDEWVPIEVVIDLANDTQSFYYGGDLLYTGTWTQEVSGGGVPQIAALDLYANSASSIFYDDVSISNLPFLDGFENEDTDTWHYTQAD